MRKFYSLFIALLTVCGLAKAQVEFDFANNNLNLPVSTSDNQDAGNVTEISSGGVTITFDNGTASTKSRLWSATAGITLRVYKGSTFTISADKEITSINFDAQASNFGLDAAPEGLNAQKWTGSAKSVTFTPSKTNQIRAITVSFDGGDTPGPGPDPGEIDWTSSATSPLTVAQLQEKAAKLEGGKNSDKEVYVKGKISQIDEISPKLADGSGYGNATYYISDDGTTTNQFYVYRGKGLKGADFTTENDIKVGDNVVVVGVIKNYVKNEVSTLEFDQGNRLYSLNGDTGGDDPGPQPGEAKGDGTLANPYNAVAASQLAKALPVGEISAESYYIQGKISSVKFYFDVDHGTATFFISDDGTTANEFQVYSVYYLGNRAWKEGDTQIKVGDSVIIYGQLINYSGTPETASKKCCLYSLNGETDGGDTPQPTYKEYTAIAPMKADVTSSRADVVFKAKDLLVTFVSGNSLYLYDGTDGLLVYGANSGIKAGDKITADIKGQLYLYNGLTEIAVSVYENLTINSSDNAVEPQKVTVADVISKARDYENELVQIEGLYAQAEALASRNVNFMDDSDNEIVVRDNFNVLTGTTFDTEAEYTVTGFVTIFTKDGTTTTQLYPRTAEDVSNGEAPQPYEFTGDGTIDNPYTVEDIQHKDATSTKEALESGVWVKAYIVGYINGSSLSENTAIFSADAPEGTDKDGNPLTVTVSNILVADAAGANTIAAVIPVGTVNKSVAREDLNLADNPEMLGQQVWLKGDIFKYMGFSGLKNVSEYSLNGSDIVTAISTVEATAAAQGAIYTIAGQRIQHINHAGLYIVGGKKVAVK